MALLIAKGADPNVQDDRDRRPLMNAARVGDEKTVVQLLKRGADPNRAKTAMKWTALMWAVRHQRVPIVKHLINVGADPSASETLGRTAWLFAGSDRGAERAAAMATLISSPALPPSRSPDGPSSCLGTGSPSVPRPHVRLPDPHRLQPRPSAEAYGKAQEHVGTKKDGPKAVLFVFRGLRVSPVAR